jgi:protein involved in polysaccharide export with SLBB domain
VQNREENAMTSGRMTMAGTLWRCVACRFRRWLRAAALLSGLAFSSAVLADSPGESRDYKLAPGDRITVSVVGQAELSGDMLLDGAGDIILTLIGAIEVRDLTIVECQRVIHDRLADGILNQPSVIVAVAAAGGFGLPEPMQNASAFQIHEAEAIFKRQIISELRDVGERLKELDVVLPVAGEIREVRLAQAGSLAGAETARSISVTHTRNGEVTSFQATETRPWSPATSSKSRGCFPASCATRALRPGNLVYKIIKWERQRQRDRLVWLSPSS